MHLMRVLVDSSVAVRVAAMPALADSSANVLGWLRCGIWLTIVLMFQVACNADLG